jgi:chorismate dehydratase
LTLRGRRLAAFRYLNSAPLLAGLLGPRRAPGAEDLRFLFGTPAQCARHVADGDAVGGLIPTIEFARIDGLEIVPGVAISTERRVRSVILVARRPPARCGSIAVDAASRTSVALLRILLARRYGTRPDLEVMEPDAVSMLARHDAALLIADSALRDLPADVEVHDLADEWHAMTGLPFVFAVWALRPGAPSGLAALLVRSRDVGLANLERIATEEGPAIGLPPADALAYLRENIRYELGERERGGLQRFLELAAEEGLAPAAAAGRTSPGAAAAGMRP